MLDQTKNVSDTMVFRKKHAVGLDVSFTNPQINIIQL